MREYNEGSITEMGYLSLVSFYRGKLVVEGICLIAVVCDWFIIYSQGWNANVFCFVCLDNDQNRFGFVFILSPMWSFTWDL